MTLFFPEGISFCVSKASHKCDVKDYTEYDVITTLAKNMKPLSQRITRLLSSIKLEGNLFLFGSLEIYLQQNSLTIAEGFLLS